MSDAIGDGGINYGRFMERAMRRVLGEVLGHVAEHGLTGEHHFYITFETTHPGVDIPAWLRERYPKEMMIVMQDWFDNLAVTTDRFTVTLNFSDRVETLVVPLDAVVTFIDPSVKFGLKFDDHESGEDEDDADFPAEDDDAEDAEEGDLEPAGAGERGADVVSLDTFRKT